MLDPKYTLAYYNRALVWRDKGELDRAVADYTEAIKLDASDPDFFNNRGVALRDKGELDRAIADFTEAIRMRPKGPGPYFNRGMSHFYGGAPAKALADFNQAMMLNPKFAYNALWADIAAQRSQGQSRLAQAAAALDMNKWPAPVVRLFLGQLTTAGVLAMADAPDAKIKREQLCEANFYNGIWELRQDANENAARFFRSAADGCPRTYDEWFAANAELKQLVR